MPCFKTQLVCLLFCCFLLLFFWENNNKYCFVFFAQRDQPRDSAENIGVELLVLA